MNDSDGRGLTSVSRRGFLQAVGAAAVAPVILGATDKSGTKRPVVGSGAHTFEVHHDWGELPSSIRYGNTHGVCEDEQGHIYVHHTVHASSERHDSMVVFDRDGRFVRSWGREFEGGAHGLHIRKEGNQEFLYLCDTKRAVVVKATTDGDVVWTLGYPKESPHYTLDAQGAPATKYSPTNVAIAPNGDVYVADGYGSSYINQYDRDGPPHPHVRGEGQGRGPTRLSARARRGRAGTPAGAARGRSEQPPPPDLFTRRHAHRLPRRHERAVPFPRSQGRDGGARPLRARHADRPGQHADRAPG
jgi:hypothetical protein